MSRLNIKIGTNEFQNPIFVPSGCFGHAYELKEFTDISKLGGISPKTVTRVPKAGNPPPRIWHGTGSHSHSIGLQNPGIDVYLEEKVPKMLEVCRPDQLIISLAGNNQDDYVYNAGRILETVGYNNFAAFELNAACPNVAAGGSAFCRMPANLESLVKAVREVVGDKTLIVKTNTFFENFQDAGKAVEAGGADALYTANSSMGMSINVQTRKPHLGNKRGGLGGPALLPYGILKTWDLYNAINIPIIASGGVTNLDGVLQYLMAGATCVAIGAALFADPMLPARMPAELDAWLEAEGINHYSELIGIAHQE